MCIICECNKALTKEEFHECWTSNSHGAGFAWHKDGKNHYIKGFMAKDKAWEAYQLIPVPHIAHFRLASSGGVHADLTHPFIVSTESPISHEWEGEESLLAHNGTISDWNHMLFALCAKIGHLPPGEMSDTRFVAMAVASMGEDAFAFFGYSKFAMLDGKGMIFRYGTGWEQNEGNWYTNSGYKTSRYVHREVGYYGGDYGNYPSTYQGVDDPTYWNNGNDDSDIPLSQRNCLNCKQYIGIMLKNQYDVAIKWNCKVKGITHNIMKCAEWAEKRGRGRPRNKKKNCSDRNRKDGNPRKIPRELAGTSIVVTTAGQLAMPFNREGRVDGIKGEEAKVSARRTCLGCEHYNGSLMCEKKPARMTNINPCAEWTEAIGDKQTTFNHIM